MTSLPSIQVQSFTTKFDGRSNVLATEIAVQPSFDSSGKEIGMRIPDRKILAIWDTGATSSCISERVAQDLGLPVHGGTRISTPNGMADKNTFLVDYFLPNGLRIHMVQVAGVDIDERFDALIGMDIIGLGDFAVTCFEGRTVFSFRYPSMQCLDFAAYKYSAQAVRQFVANRNDLCPCGSKAKYKNCHGKKV